MSNENPQFSSITNAMNFLSLEENKDIPAVAIWPTVNEISIEDMTKDEVDWFTGLGLQLVMILSKLPAEDVDVLGLDVYEIADKTDRAHKRFYP